MIHSGTKKLIEKNAMGLSTVSKDGSPHTIAVACCKVSGNKIVISNSHINESIKNIERNNHVSLVVWNKDWEKVCVGFEIKGKAKNFARGKWLNYVTKLPDNKGCTIKSAIVVNVGKIKKLLS
jgi:predicted pyridoxine 5'-phosphate oxidase superfamily flavin-nucleotide-binding protein